MRRSLISALASCARLSTREDALRFLHGLSADELQFIAAFLGGRMISAEGYRDGAPSEREEDLDLKLIVLREYLTVSGLEGRGPERHAAAASN